jgi:hypothetical protein
MNDETLARLKRIGTATIAKLLYKKGYRNCYVQGVLPLAQGQDRPKVQRPFLRKHLTCQHQNLSPGSRWTR